MPPDSLAFSFSAGKEKLFISHFGRLVMILKGAKAQAAIQRLELANAEEAQQILARLTGNYKRGNERTASPHSKE